MNPLLRQNSILTARESGRGEEDADYFLKLEIDLLGIEIGKKNTFLYNIGILEKLLFRNEYIRE